MKAVLFKATRPGDGDLTDGDPTMVVGACALSGGQGAPRPGDVEIVERPLIS